MLIESPRSETDGVTVEREPFLQAGRVASGEFRCCGCGYGVVVRNVLPSCPMCQGVEWETSVGGRVARPAF